MVRSRPIGVLRYAAAWLAASALFALAVAALVGGDPERPEPLIHAAERAGCRFSSNGVNGQREVVLSYSPALSGSDVKRVRALATRLVVPAVATAQDPPQTKAIAAHAGDERLACPRVDGRAAMAIELFVLSFELDR